MSSRRSSTDGAGARRAADEARRRPPAAGDDALRAVRGAAVGAAALVRSPRGAPEFWIVPFVASGRACGYARVLPSGRVAQVASFGSDPASWPAEEFFDRPPAAALEEIRRRDPGASLGTPSLSYDRSASRWGWRVELVGREEVAFVTPGGWRLLPASRREGASASRRARSRE